MTYDRTGWAVKFVGEIRLEGRQEEELEFRKYHRKMDYYYYYYIFSSLNLNMYIYIYRWPNGIYRSREKKEKLTLAYFKERSTIEKRVEEAN